MKTNEMKHTPGPWVSHGHYGIIQIESETRDICDVDVCDDEDKANALLIAAAPELLEALNKVPLFKLTNDALGWECCGCGAVSGITEEGTERDESCKEWCYVPRVEAAIARATTPTTEGGL